MSSDGLWMFFSVDVFANVRPLLEVFVGLFVVLFVFMKDSDVDVEAASKRMVFAKRQFGQFHNTIVKLLLFGASARGENT